VGIVVEAEKEKASGEKGKASREKEKMFGESQGNNQTHHHIVRIQVDNVVVGVEKAKAKVKTKAK
jgi:hypothetical protein